MLRQEVRSDPRFIWIFLGICLFICLFQNIKGWLFIVTVMCAISTSMYHSLLDDSTWQVQLSSVDPSASLGINCIIIIGSWSAASSGDPWCGQHILPPDCKQHMEGHTELSGWKCNLYTTQFPCEVFRCTAADHVLGWSLLYKGNIP